MEAIKTIYSSDFISIFSPDIEIAVDISETKEVAFILVLNKKYKKNSKDFFLSSISFSNSRSKTLLIL